MQPTLRFPRHTMSELLIHVTYLLFQALLPLHRQQSYFKLKKKKKLNVFLMYRTVFICYLLSTVFIILIKKL